MELYKKYIKYKNKYINLKKIKSEGGYRLNDDSSEKFYLSKIKKHFIKYNNYFEDVDFIISATDRIIMLKEKIKIFNSSDYINMYDTFLYSYKNMTKYTQQFIDNKGQQIAQNLITSYHLNFGALMFMSFLLEYELLSLLHTIVKINTFTNQANNTLPAIFSCGGIGSSSCSSYRIYKDDVINKPIDVVTIFTSKLDEIFEKFMLYFIFSLAQNDKDRAILYYENIVPIHHVDHITNTHDFIFVDWIDRLNRLGLSDDYIRHHLQTAIVNISAGISDYIAEGTGFFSFIFLYFPGKIKEYYGSCITSSLFEMYIFSRLHIDAKDIYLVLEKQDPKRRHLYWNYVQDELRIPYVSHWSTEINIKGATIKFRNFFNPPVIKYTYLNNYTEILISLLYPIFDSYIRYIKPLLDIPMYDCCKTIIETFIDDRVKIIGTLSKKILARIFTKEIFDMSIDFNPEEELPIDIKINFNRIKNNDNKPIIDFNIFNDRGQSLLYVAARAGNIELVNKLLEFPTTNINIKNTNNDTPLKGACVGLLHILDKIPHNSPIYINKIRQNRFNIIQILFNKGASTDNINESNILLPYDEKQIIMNLLNIKKN
jgi:hypothetical protein